MFNFITPLLKSLVLTTGLCAVTAGLSQEVKEPIKLLLRIEAATQTNPDETGRPSPIKIRIYELKDSNTFAESDYFSLSTNDKNVLGADLLARDEFILRPGESRKLERKSHPKTVALGILAGYRDLNSIWREIHTLPEAPEAAWYRALIPGKTTDLAIHLQPQGIVLVPAH